MTCENHLINPFQKYGYLSGQIRDETIAAQKDKKTVLVRTTGHEKLRVIMMLSVLTDWWIQTLFVFLKKNNH